MSQRLNPTFKIPPSSRPWHIARPSDAFCRCSGRSGCSDRPASLVLLRKHVDRILREDGNQPQRPEDDRGATEVQLTASCDGRHWLRVGEREVFLPLGEPDAWDADYPEPVTPPLLVGDQLWIYYRSGGTASSAAIRSRHPRHCIGLAKLRRDGFVSLNAGTTPGRIVTRPLTFRGTRLYVNAEISGDGYIKAELQTRSGRTVEPFTSAACFTIGKGWLQKAYQQPSFRSESSICRWVWLQPSSSPAVVISTQPYRVRA